MVNEKDAINCKLYWNGSMASFIPSDMKKAFQYIFNMKWNGDKSLKEDEESLNEKFVNGEISETQKQEEDFTIDRYIEIMEETIKDRYFDNFHKNFIKHRV